MDSGNSDSLQSSSGGEDEFDSRAAAAAAAAIMNSSSNNHRRQEVLVGGRGRGCGSALLINNGSISNQQPPLQLSSGMFVDSLSTATMATGFLFDSISRPFHHHGNNNSNNSVLSLDMAGWSKSLRSDPNCTGNINSNDDGDNRNNNSGLLPSTSCSSSLQSLFVHQGQLQSPPGVSIPPPTVVVVPTPENSSTSSATTAPAAVPDHQQLGTQTHAPRNPKKRSRASRRAPTTVLTTDTTNFRAMVQEFTGIPAPPFTAATSPFPRARILDLYGTPSSIRSNHHHLLPPLDSSTSQPTYLRRPFPQKVQLPPPPSPFLSSSSSPSSSSQLSPPPPPNATASAASPPPLISYQQSSSLFNIPHPILTSLLQSNHSKPSHHYHHQIPSNDSGGLKISSFLDDDFGLGHVGSVNPTTSTTTNTSLINNLPGLISSDQTLPSRNNINNENPPPPQPPPTSSINWGGNGMMGSVHDHNDNAGGTKLNFSTSVSTTSIFPSDKMSSTTDNAGTSSNNNNGGGGMMESWICSSSE